MRSQTARAKRAGVRKGSSNVGYPAYARPLSRPENGFGLASKALPQHDAQH